MRTTTDSRPDSPCRHPVTAMLAMIAARAKAAWAVAERGLSRQAMNRRVLHRLSVLSDRDLADIGLARSDLRDAALSENGDAAHFLVARRNERRCTHRGHYPF